MAWAQGRAEVSQAPSSMIPKSSSQDRWVVGGHRKQEPAWGLTSLGMKDDPSVTRDQKAMPPHIRYFRLYLSPR